MPVEAIDINDWYAEINNSRKPKPIISEETMIQWMKLKYGDYWIGPANVLIPWEIQTVPDIDGCNRCGYYIKDENNYSISSSEVWCGDSLRYTEKQYRDIFAEQRADGKWYWSTNDGNDID
jgi:hypothetical protein